MIGDSNGQRLRYRVSYSKHVAKVIQELRFEAFMSGRLQRFDRAWQIILERLRADPQAFGEFIRPYAHLNLRVHVGSVHPITVRFGINEDVRIVFLAKMILAT